MPDKTKEIDLKKLAAEIGKRLRTYLETNGISMQEMAEGAGVTRQQLRRYLKGEDLPQTKVLVRLTLYTGRSTQWILFGDEADDRVPKDPDVRECMFDLEAASPQCRRTAIQTTYGLIAADLADAQVLRLQK